MHLAARSAAGITFTTEIVGLKVKPPEEGEGATEAFGVAMDRYATPEERLKFSLRQGFGLRCHVLSKHVVRCMAAQGTTKAQEVRPCARQCTLFLNNLYICILLRP